MMSLLGFKDYTYYLLSFVVMAWPLFSRNLAQVELALLLQSTLILVLGFSAASLWGRQRPGVRSLVYRMTLSGVALVTLFSIVLAGRIQPYYTLSLPSAQPAEDIYIAHVWDTHHDLTSTEKLQLTPSPISSQPPLATAKAAAQPDTAMTEKLLPPSDPPPNPRQFWTPDFLLGCFYLLMIVSWLGGILLQTAWLCGCQLYMLRLRRRSVAIMEGETVALLRQFCATRRIKAPLLLTNNFVQSPLLTGLWRPAILLPTNYTTAFEGNILKAILLHELAHQERRDCAWNLVARLTRILLWTQPLLWLLCRRMEQAAEEICDEAVINGGCPPHEYAQCLLDLTERLALKRVERTVGAGVIPLRSALGQRVRHILAFYKMDARPIAARMRLYLGLGTVGAVISSAVLIASATTARTYLGHGTIRGRVLYPDGHPVAGVSVSAAMPTEDEAKLRYWLKQQNREFAGATNGLTTTRSNGSFELDGLASGNYEAQADTYPLNVTSYQEPPAWVGTPMLATTDDHSPTAAPNIMLTRGAIVQGHVVDNGTGQPLPGIYVNCEYTPPPFILSQSAYTVTDAHGYFKLRVASGHNALSIGGRGETRYMYVHWDRGATYKTDLQIIKSGAALYAVSDWRTVDVAAQPPHYQRGDSTQAINLKPGQTQNIQFRLKPMTVTMRQGEPVVEIPASVPAALKQSISAPVTQPAQTFHLPPGVKGTAAITGRVLFEDGRPAAGIKVIALMNYDYHWKLARHVLGHTYLTISWPPALQRIFSATDTTDVMGTYHLTGLTTAPYHVILSDPLNAMESDDSFATTATAALVQAKEHTTLTAPTLTLVGGAILQGRVIDATNQQPLAGVQIICYDPGHPLSAYYRHIHSTDKQGHFSFRVAPGQSIFAVVGPRLMLYPKVFNLSPTEQTQISKFSYGSIFSVCHDDKFYAGRDWVQMTLMGKHRSMGKGGWGEVTIQEGQNLEVVLRLKRLTIKVPKSSIPSIMPDKYLSGSMPSPPYQ